MKNYQFGFLYREYLLRYELIRILEESGEDPLAQLLKQRSPEDCRAFTRFTRIMSGESIGIVDEESLSVFTCENTLLLNSCSSAAPYLRACAQVTKLWAARSRLLGADPCINMFDWKLQGFPLPDGYEWATCGKSYSLLGNSLGVRRSSEEDCFMRIDQEEILTKGNQLVPAEVLSPFIQLIRSCERDA